jgi:DNA (cytosine-5)-methyltransferase 1
LILGTVELVRFIIIMLRHLDLFSGIGGFSLGLEATGGFETVAFCDIEEYPRKVLQKHWPHVKQYKNIKELTYERLKADGLVPIDIITGGYPCQPFSVAGKQKGVEDPRHLWPEYFRLIKECRPTWIIGENVSGHIKLGLDSVIEDLESENYSVRTFSVSASSVGASHQRERIWVVAYSERNYNFNEEQRVHGEEKEIPGERGENDSPPREPGRANTIRKTNDGDVADTESFGSDEREDRNNSKEKQKERNVRGQSSDVANTESDKEDGVLRTARSESDQGNPWMESSSSRDGQPKREAPQDMADTDSEGLERQWKSRNQFGSEFTAAESGEGRQGEMGQGWWSIEPDVGRVAHGIPKRVDRLKSLGNSLVPQIPYYIGQSILQTYNVADTNIN